VRAVSYTHLDVYKRQLQRDHDAFRITTQQQRIAAARKNIRRYIKPGTRLVDELIAERREAAKRE